MGRKKTKEFIERECDWCGSTYVADPWYMKRGWMLCCSKSCAAKKRRHKMNEKRLVAVDGNWNKDWF